MKSGNSNQRKFWVSHRILKHRETKVVPNARGQINSAPKHSQRNQTKRHQPQRNFHDQVANRDRCFTSPTTTSISQPPQHGNIISHRQLHIAMGTMTRTINASASRDAPGHHVQKGSKTTSKKENPTNDKYPHHPSLRNRKTTHRIHQPRRHVARFNQRARKSRQPKQQQKHQQSQDAGESSDQ